MAYIHFTGWPTKPPASQTWELRNRLQRPFAVLYSWRNLWRHRRADTFIVTLESVVQCCEQLPAFFLASSVFYLLFSWVRKNCFQQAAREAATICPRPRDLDLWPFDLESDVRVTCDVGYLCANFSLPRRLSSRLRPDVRDRQIQTSDRQTSDIIIA